MLDNNKFALVYLVLVLLNIYIFHFNDEFQVNNKL